MTPPPFEISIHPTKDPAPHFAVQFSIGPQTFTLDYYTHDPIAAAWMSEQLRLALDRLVKYRPSLDPEPWTPPPPPTAGDFLITNAG